MERTAQDEINARLEREGTKPKSSLKFWTPPTPREEVPKKEDVVPSDITATGRRLRGLEKSIYQTLNRNEVARLAFEADPTTRSYAQLYRAKPRGVPDWLLTRMSVQDDLVAAIVQARCGQVATFGRPRRDRHSPGYIVEAKVGLLEEYTDEQKADLDDRIEALADKIWDCGSLAGCRDDQRLTFAQFLQITTRNAVVNGKIAVEMMYADGADGTPGGGEFLRFRPIDAGTIAPANPMSGAGDTVRKQAISQLRRMRGDESETPRDEIEAFLKGKYAWVQVVEGNPKQLFTGKECIVSNFYPVPDIAMDGWPLTPLDVAVSAVTTHINITSHNRLYFQSGRAARGMLVIQSEDVDDDTVKSIQAHFEASINSTKNAWRLPVFGIGKNDSLTWEAMEAQGGRDAEFQYLTDMNARVILSVFQMAPEELPGWAYLSRGTNSQSLSESKNEYVLEAARDLGIRPLISQFEDFMNSVILPKLDPELAKICRFSMTGLDAESRKDESAQLATDQGLYLTLNDTLRKVEKNPISPQLGGNVPLNPNFHQLVLRPHVTVGWVREHLFGYKDASKDPRFDYIPDPSYFSQQQLIQAAQQAQAQAQQAQAQGANTGGGPSGDGEASGAPADDDREPATGADGRTEGQKSGEQKTAELHRSLTGTLAHLGKSEAQLSPAHRRLLKLQHTIVDQAVKGFEADSADMLKEIALSVDRLMGR